MPPEYSRREGEQGMAAVFYNADYVDSGHAFDTTRKAKWVADSLSRSPIPGIELVSPSPLSIEQVDLVDLHRLTLEPAGASA